MEYKNMCFFFYINCVFLLFITLAFSSCSMQDGSNKNYIISQTKEKESSETEISQ